MVSVIPIYKNKGSPLDPNNYRPISLLSNLDKIFEKIIKNRLISFLDSNKIITNKQFGFRTKHSTTHALISLTETIRQNLDNCKFACGIFIDLQKAFDTVSHEILLSKLEHYGIRGVTNSWFRSYLSDRVQYVSLTNTKSKKLFIKHGVPQGSVLGPILFLLYINDLINSIIFSEIFHFADDTCMLYANHNLKKMQKHLNIDLKCIYKWLTANKIALNVAKTEVILFRQRNKAVNYDIRLKLNGKKLEFSSHVRYLGILIDEFLDWDFHISYIGNKLRKTNGALCKLRYYVPKDILLSIYHALFSSHISYSPQVWGLTSKSCRIFRLQKAALRIITFSNFNSPSNPIFLNLNILTLSDLIKFLNIILTFNIINLHSPGNICDIFKLVCHSSNHSTRSKSIKLLARPSVRTTSFGLKSIRYQSIINWNNIQQHFHQYDLASLTLKQLKKICKTYLLDCYNTNLSTA